MDLAKINKLQVDKIPLDVLKDKPTAQKEYKVPEVKLSEAIQAFDKKPRVYTKNPYDYNSISLQKEEKPTPTATEMIVDPIYNQAAKALGVDTIHDWNKYYDKVAKIVDWAREATGLTESHELASWIYSQVKLAPSMGAKKIDDVYIYSRLQSGTKAKKAPTKVKTVIKKVYVKEKISQEELVNRLIQGM